MLEQLSGPSDRAKFHDGVNDLRFMNGDPEVFVACLFFFLVCFF